VIKDSCVKEGSLFTDAEVAEDLLKKRGFSAAFTHPSFSFVTCRKS